MKQVLSSQIQELIDKRDNFGANVQDQIDVLFAKFESLCDFSQDEVHDAHDAAIARLG